MKLSQFIQLLYIIFFLNSSLLFAADSGLIQLEVRKDKTGVYMEPNKKSKLIKELNAKDNLQAAERKGMFWKVDLAGVAGFVSILDVQKSSKAVESSLSSALQKAVQSERSVDDASNVRSRSSVMGVRGLDSSSDLEFISNMKPNLNLVYSMEENKISKESLQNIEAQVYKEIETLNK